MTYCAWSPETESVAIEIRPASGSLRRLLVARSNADGYHVGLDPEGKAGDRYAFRLDARGPFPDPASRAQSGSVHGDSLVVDPRQYQWNDGAWRRPRFRDLVIYELHVGTFTRAGTFRGVIEKLPHLRDLGVSAIELMPVADFPGERNWGYDGVLIYAPARAYGTPDDLRALVDAAHRQGIAVLLDVVYNHLGPDGNYLPTFSPQFFHEHHHTPWGRAFNFDGSMSQPVREFFLRNPIYWMDEFHVDGFRFDAAHEVADDSARHIFAEMTDAIHARGGYAVAEDSRNDAQMARPTSEGGGGFDAVWADDFHHVLRVSQTREREGYFQDFAGSLPELTETLEHGWLFRGQRRTAAGQWRGTPCEMLPPAAFVHCISNHDQIGNRAFGERLNHLIDPDAYRAASVLLCLSPYTPLLFMGQEWAASTPFLYFTDHHQQLAPLVTAGRRREFAGFEAFRNRATLEQIPDPQDEQTFLQSKLDWSEPAHGTHASTLALYKACLALRQRIDAFRPDTRAGWEVRPFEDHAGVLRFIDGETHYLVIFALGGPGNGTSVGSSRKLAADRQWTLLLSSEEPRFGGNGSGFDERGQSCSFSSPVTMVLSGRSKSAERLGHRRIQS